MAGILSPAQGSAAEFRASNSHGKASPALPRAGRAG